MAEEKKTTCVIRIYEQFGEKKTSPGILRLTLEQAKKYLSSKPLRGPDPPKPSA